MSSNDGLVVAGPALLEAGLLQEAAADAELCERHSICRAGMKSLRKRKLSGTIVRDWRHRWRWCSRRRAACGTRSSVIHSADCGAPSSGAVRITELITVSCGSRMPRLPTNRLDQAPPAHHRRQVRCGPFSVTTADTLPPSCSTARTAQSVSTLAPSRRAASGDGGRRLLRLGPAVRGGVERALRTCRRRPASAVSNSSRPMMPRIELVELGVLEPSLLLRHVRVGLDAVHDAGGAKAGLGLDRPRSCPATGAGFR